MERKYVSISLRYLLTLIIHGQSSIHTIGLHLRQEDNCIYQLSLSADLPEIFFPLGKASVTR